MILTFESVDKILKCKHSTNDIEHYFPVVQPVCYVVAGGSNF